MYTSYGARSAAGGGKRGHGGRPYRPPPDKKDRSTKKPPPLKHCDCLIEMDVEEYLKTSGQRTRVSTFGSRQAMERTVRHVRNTFQCHLQIPGRNQGNPVALVALSLEVAIPACYYVLQQFIPENDRPLVARIHPNVKTHAPIIAGLLYKPSSSDPCGRLFVQQPQQSTFNNTAATDTSISWSVAYYRMADPSTQLELLQTCLDNLQFRDSSCQFQITSHENVVFAMASQSQNIDKLLAEIQQCMKDDNAGMNSSK